jgi:hypothetical protein
MSKFKVGDRVRLTRDVERYPHFTAPAGTTGVVTRVSRSAPSPSAGVTLLIRADSKIRGAEPWGNEIEWAYDEDPARDLEIIRPSASTPRRRQAARIRVTFDGDFPVVSAWGFGEHWNGWDVPYFEYRDAKKVATALTQGGTVTIYDAPTDSFYSFVAGDTEPTQDEYNRLHDEELWYAWAPVTIETPEGSKKTWSIGGMAYTWSVADEDEVDDPSIETEARRMLKRIDEDIASRPRHFSGWNGTFSGLHDFVDANEYLPPLRSGPYKGEVLPDESADPDAFERALGRANAIIAEVDRLLAQRRRARHMHSSARRRPSR